MGVNRAILSGTIGQYGVKLTYTYAVAVANCASLELGLYVMTRVCGE